MITRRTQCMTPRTAQSACSAYSAGGDIWRRMTRGSVAILLGASLACGSDTTGTAPLPGSQLYMQLTLNHHAITLATVAPYDTITLIATPRNADGAPLPATARPTFATSDTSITIDSTGLVRVFAAATKTGIVVTARLTVRGVTLVDTAYVNVIQQSSAAAVPVMTALQLRPVAGDSAIRAGIISTEDPVTQTFAFPFVTTATGDSIPNTVVRFASSNPLVAVFQSPTIGTVSAVSIGRVLLTAEATVYGRRTVDSLWYTVGWPTAAVVKYGSYLANSSLPVLPNTFQLGDSVVVGQGGKVFWVNHTEESADNLLDVVFDDPTAAGATPDSSYLASPFYGIYSLPPDVGGNIPAFATLPPTVFFDPNEPFWIDTATNIRVRTFPRVGVYHWHSLHQKINGTVTVKSNSSITSVNADKYFVRPKNGSNGIP